MTETRKKTPNPWRLAKLEVRAPTDEGVRGVQRYAEAASELLVRAYQSLDASQTDRIKCWYLGLRTSPVDIVDRFAHHRASLRTSLQNYMGA